MALEQFLAKEIAEHAGAYKGAEVRALHRCVVEKICAGKTGWDALQCVVDNMDKIYSEAEEVGVKEALSKYTCIEFLE